MNQALGIAALVAIGAATFQLGGAAPGAAPLVACVAALLALVHAVRGARAPRALEPRFAAIVALASVPLAVGALELVPLPRGAVATLAPATARVYDADDAASGAAPGARPLSIEPGTSRRALERGLAWVALFVLAAGIARQAADARALAFWLIALGLLVATCGLGLSDTSSFAEDVFKERARAPFKNPNHFATFIELLLPLALGVALGGADGDERRPPPSLARLAERPDLLARLGAVACVGVFVAAIFRSQSRAGVLAAAFGSLVAIGASRALSRGRFAVATALFVAAALGTTWANARIPPSRLASARESFATRVEYWRLGLRVLEGRALTGSGLGTYDAASFARLTSETSSVLFLRPERAHNDYVNLASDLGLPAAAAAIAAAALAVFAVWRRLGPLGSESRAIAAGALGGAIAGLVHAFFDFGLELAPIGALFAVVLGLAWGASTPPGAGAAAPRGRASLRWAAAALLAVTAGLAALDLVAERAAVDAGLVAGPLDPAKLDPEKLAAARRLAPDDALLAVAEAHARRAKGLGGAIEAARAAVRAAPASATAQAELALALLDAPASERSEPARVEGERRLALALELGPSWGALHFAAGCYWVDRAAATNDTAIADRAVHELHEASRLQLSDQPPFLESGRARVKKHLQEGRLGALGEDMVRRLAPAK